MYFIRHIFITLFLISVVYSIGNVKFDLKLIKLEITESDVQNFISFNKTFLERVDRKTLGLSGTFEVFKAWENVQSKLELKVKSGSKYKETAFQGISDFCEFFLKDKMFVPGILEKSNLTKGVCPFTPGVYKLNKYVPKPNGNMPPILTSEKNWIFVITFINATNNQIILSGKLYVNIESQGISG